MTYTPAIKYDVVEFGGKRHIIREVLHLIENSLEFVTVAAESLEEMIFPNNHYASWKARLIDEQIYCFVPDEYITVSDEELSAYVDRYFD